MSVLLNALVVGSGWGRHAATAFARRGDVRIAGVVGRGSPRTQHLARELQVPVFRTVEDAVREDRIDLAVVAVGDRENSVLATELLMHGAHVLCAHPVGATADDVRRVAELARERGLLVSADYSLRSSDAFAAARSAITTAGTLLRAEITFPGRFLPMALDLAVALGGHVVSVSAFGRYPPAVSAQRSRSPAAFPPTVILEHAAGCVTALTPVPHARATHPVRMTTSGISGRVDAELPAGDVALVRCRRGGMVETRTWHARPGVDGAADVFANAMVRTADLFVDAVRTGGAPPCSLEDEVEVRMIWDAITRSLRHKAPVSLVDVPVAP